MGLAFREFVAKPVVRQHEYVAVVVPIEHYHRQDEGWSYRVYRGLSGKVAIPSIDCRLKLADVYERVKFPELDDDA